MDLDALLDQAKANLAKDTAKEDVFEELEAIPKLQADMTVGKQDRAAAKSHRPATVIKSIPTAEKPQKVNDAGKNWFNMSKPEMTAAVKRDLALLKMRHAIDPKRFYKKETGKPSEYFAVGTIQESPDQFYSARLTRKQRKNTLAEEILAARPDYYKSRYEKIQEAKRSGRKRHQKKTRDMRA